MSNIGFFLLVLKKRFANIKKNLFFALFCIILHYFALFLLTYFIHILGGFFMNRFRTIFVSFFLLIFVSLLMGQSGCTCNICFYLDFEDIDCRLTANDYNSTTIDVDVFEWVDAPGGPMPSYLGTQSGNPFVLEDRRVSGYEINFGFWSKDAYREYTYEELYEWKHGVPPTPAQAAAITDQQAKDWFDERHTVKRPWYLGGNDKPRDVRTFERRSANVCTTLEKGVDYLFAGEAKWPDGTKCKLVMKEQYFGDKDCPAFIPMKIEKPCNKCN